MSRGIGTGLALSGCSLLLTLGALELAARRGLFDNPQPRSTKVEAKARSALERPNFRTSVPTSLVSDERFRILVVGDSFAWGDGVHPEDTFASRLEVRLDAVSRGRDFEVLNWSRPGWNTVAEYESVESNIDRLTPDLLLLAFVLNDPEPLEPQRVEKLRTNLQSRQPRSLASSYLYRHSRFYSTAWDRIENTRIHRAYDSYYHSLFEGPDWKSCLRALERFRDLAWERSMPMVLVVFPIFDSPMDESYAYLTLHHKMGEVGRSLGVPVLDLLEAYRGVDVYRLAVVPYTDAHPNELAHRIAADAILDFLARGRLVPRLDYVPPRQRERWQQLEKPTSDVGDGAP